MQQVYSSRFWNADYQHLLSLTEIYRRTKLFSILIIMTPTVIIKKLFILIEIVVHVTSWIVAVSVYLGSDFESFISAFFPHMIFIVYLFAIRPIESSTEFFP